MTAADRADRIRQHLEDMEDDLGDLEVRVARLARKIQQLVAKAGDGTAGRPSIRPESARPGSLHGKAVTELIDYVDPPPPQLYPPDLTPDPPY